MIGFILLIALLVLNGWFGVNDVKKGNTTKSAAFTWFVVGWLSFHMFVHTLPTLL
jgi:hypothetical protein